MSELREYYGNALVRIWADDADDAERVLDLAVREGVFKIDPEQHGSILTSRVAFEALDDPAVLDDWKRLDRGVYGNGSGEVDDE